MNRRRQSLVRPVTPRHDVPEGLGLPPPRARYRRPLSYLKVDLLQSLGADVRERNRATVVRLLPGQHALAAGHTMEVCAMQHVRSVSIRLEFVPPTAARSRSTHPRAPKPRARFFLHPSSPPTSHRIIGIPLHTASVPPPSRVATSLARTHSQPSTPSASPFPDARSRRRTCGTSR